MADYTISITLPDHKRGDRWIGILQIGPILIDGATPAAPLTRVRMMFRRRRGTQVYVIDSDPEGTPEPNAPAVIDDAEDWIAHIPPIQDFLAESGNWDWDMEFYDDDNEAPLTIYKGLLVCHNDVSR